MRSAVKIILIVFFLIVLVACKHTSANYKDSKKHPLQKRAAAHLSATSTDILVINKAAAVFTTLDSVEINKRIKQSGREGFEDGADDYVYYSSMADEFLKKKPIHIINVDSHVHYLKFVKTDGSSTSIKLDTVANLFNLYLFTPSKLPHNADMTSIDQEYKDYFTKK